MPGLSRQLTLSSVKQLVVLAYVDEYRAVEVLGLLQRLHTGSIVPLEDAVGVIRGTDWNVRLHHGMNLAQPEDACLRFWRGLVASLVLAPGTADCRRTGRDYGILPTFERDLRANLPPGSSAVFMIVADATLEQLMVDLYRLGGTLLHSPLAMSA